MSFILDALKKAESERNRNSGPVLMDVRISAPRRRLPTWAWVLGSVLLANLLVLAWLLMRPASTRRTAATGASVTAPAAPPAALAVAPAALPPPAAAPAPTAPLPAASGDILPPVNATPPRSTDNLPTLQDLQAAGETLPSLQLHLHFYDATPAQRYVLLNGKRLAEGEFTTDGVKVEQITPQGVVLDAGGRRFRLLAGG
ncbi:MAG: general secretion pathway protein GspB [Steroidobacteraceae bacterium]